MRVQGKSEVIEAVLIAALSAVAVKLGEWAVDRIREAAEKRGSGPEE